MAERLQTFSGCDGTPVATICKVERQSLSLRFLICLLPAIELSLATSKCADISDGWF